MTRRWLPSRRLARRSRGLVLGGMYDGDARRSVTVAAFTALVALDRGYPTANTIKG